MHSLSMHSPPPHSFFNHAESVLFKAVYIIYCLVKARRHGHSDLAGSDCSQRPRTWRYRNMCRPKRTSTEAAVWRGDWYTSDYALLLRSTSCCALLAIAGAGSQIGAC